MSEIQQSLSRFWVTYKLSVHSKCACTFQNACDLFNSCRFLIVTVASLSVGKHEFYYICTVLVLQVYLVQYLIFAK